MRFQARWRPAATAPPCRSGLSVPPVSGLHAERPGGRHRIAHPGNRLCPPGTPVGHQRSSPSSTTDTCGHRRYKANETRTSCCVQMVASQRGVAAPPRWLVQDYAARLDIVPVRLGAKGIAKQTHLGAREADLQTDYLEAFVELARGSSAGGGDGGRIRR